MVRNIIQDLNLNSSIFFFSLGPLPNTDVKNIVPSRFSITREIGRQAKDIRECEGVELRNAVKQGCLAIGPDMWKDKFKQNSYLGLTAHYVDDQYCLHSIDLCCEPYNEINQRAENIRKVRIKRIEFFLFVFLVFFFISSLGNHLRSFSSQPR